MNRQLVIRGAAVSVAAIAASVFLAGQFLGDRQTFAEGAITGAPIEVRGASVVSPFGSTTLPANMEPELEFSALDNPPTHQRRPSAQERFQPELTLCRRNPPREKSLCECKFEPPPGKSDGLIEVSPVSDSTMGERVSSAMASWLLQATLDQRGQPGEPYNSCAVGFGRGRCGLCPMTDVAGATSYRFDP